MEVVVGLPPSHSAGYQNLITEESLVQLESVSAGTPLFQQSRFSPSFTGFHPA